MALLSPKPVIDTVSTPGSLPWLNALRQTGIGVNAAADSGDAGNNGNTDRIRAGREAIRGTDG